MRICLLLILSLLISNITYAKEKVVLAADYWCPYNCDPKDPNPGLLVEIAQKALSKHGVEVEYKLMPWEEALSAADRGEIDGVIGASILEARKLITPFTPQGYNQVSLFARKNEHIEFLGFSELKNKVFALSTGYNYPKDFQDFIDKNYPKNPKLFQFSSGLNSAGDNLTKLTDNKADLIVENEYVVKYNLKSEIENISKLTTIGIPESLFIAFSPKTRNCHLYSNIIDRELDNLRNDGTLRQLYSRYNLR